MHSWFPYVVFPEIPFSDAKAAANISYLIQKYDWGKDLCSQSYVPF